MRNIRVTTHAEQRMEEVLELADRYLADMYRFFHACMGKTGAASDSVRELFVWMFGEKKLRQSAFEPQIQLYRAAVKMCNEHGRGWRNRRHAVRSALQDISSIDLAEETRMAILLLPLPMRIILVLSDVCGLSREQIGQILNINEAETANRLSRARRKLRDLLVRHMPSENGAVIGNCERMHELCSLYVDGTINETDKAQLLDHIENCSRCSTYLQALTEVGRQMAKLECEPPEQLAIAVREAVQHEMENLPIAARRRNNLQIAILLVIACAGVIALVCSGVFSGLFLNGTRASSVNVAGSGTVAEEATERVQLPDSVKIPTSVAASSYCFSIVVAPGADAEASFTLEGLGTLVERDERSGIEYYKVKNDMALLEKMSARLRNSGYLENSSTDGRITISKDANEGLVILMRD
ncbi:MAG: sigma factor-like helix-turn-helix DNA-binding protein [Butyricicoccaceae bacterium]